MNFLRLLLLLFIPLISLAVVPIPDSLVKDSIYTVRLYLTIALALGGGLILVSQSSKGQSVFSVVRQNFTGDKPINWLALIATAYCLWMFVCSGLSVLPGFAWLGYPATEVGSIFLASCWVILFLFSAASPIVPIMRAMTITTVIMTLFAFLESLGLTPLIHFVHSPSMLYPAVTIGHRPHLGGWFAIGALAPIFFYRNRAKDGWYWLWLISGLIGLGLSTSSTASAGVTLALLGWLCFSFKQRQWQQPLLALTLLGISLIALPPTTKALSLSLGLTPPVLKDYGSTGSFKPRLYLWKAAWTAAIERPLTGWGDDTFAFQGFEHLSDSDAISLIRAELGFGPEYHIIHRGSAYVAFDPSKKNPNKVKTGSLLYIRPHNVIMDELYSHGFVGLFLFLSFSFLLIAKLFKENRKDALLFCLAFAPYVIYLMGWFYVVSVTPLFFALVGCALADLKQTGLKSKEVT